MQKSHADKPASQSPSGSSPSEGRNLNIHALRHHYLLQMQGGRLYPERIPLNAMERVLDIGCATGEWVFDMAKRHPHLHLFGIDGNEAALHIARVRRNLSNLQRVEFRQMDITQPLAITDRLFDFVHMRNG